MWQEESHCEQGHVGDAVFESAGYEREQAPEYEAQFGGVARGLCRLPEGEADEPIGKDRSEEKRIQGRFILVAVALTTKSLKTGASKVPPFTMKTASSALPVRFPIQVQAQLAARSDRRVLPARVPKLKIMLLPVKSSAPANTTRVKATPKDAPITSFVAGEPAAARGAPIVNTRTTPIPTYIPASADNTRCESSERSRL